MAKTIKMNEFMLIPTNDGVTWEFDSAIEKEAFIKTRDARGYEIYPNYARLHLYMVIDTEGNGWCLTPRGSVTLEEAKRVIKQYL